jgi:hypothetical protein
MNSNYRGVAFLLSLGSLPIACGDDKQTTETDDTGNGPTPNTSSVGTSTTEGPGGTSTGPVNPTTGPDSTTSTSDPQDTETPVTTFLTTNTTTEGDETGPPVFPPPENPICLEYANHIAECYPRYAGYINAIGYYCDQYIKEGMRLDGPACVEALEALYTCFSNIPCGEEPPADPCEAQSEAAAMACPNTFDNGVEVSTGTDSEGDSGESGISSSTG